MTVPFATDKSNLSGNSTFELTIVGFLTKESRFY